MAGINRLTQAAINAARPPCTQRDGDGLMLRMDVGRARWVLRITITGKRVDLGVGAYPEVSLKEARQKAQEWRELARRGIDPRSQRTGASGAHSGSREPTFGEIFETFFELHAQRLSNGKHRAQWGSTLNTYASNLMSMPVSAIKAAHIVDALKPIWFVKCETASRVLQRIGAVLDHAEGLDLIESNPVTKARKTLGDQEAVVKHRPSMAYAEVPKFVAKLRDGAFPCGPMVQLGLQLLVLTALRPGEVRQAPWSEFDLGGALWNIPKERMKGRKKKRRPHSVPLSTQALAVLREVKALRIRSPYLFPSSTGRPLSDMAFMSLLHRIGIGTEVTAHGFRSSFRVWAAHNGIPREIADACLAHVIKDKVEAAYLRTDFLEQRKAVMQRWADHVMPPT